MVMVGIMSAGRHGARAVAENLHVLIWERERKNELTENAVDF